jgi:peroxiredoxin (alkyl hydroperoxide reductase subunit C)
MSVLVGKRAPDFTAKAVLGDGSIVERFTLSEALRGRYGLLFFYPKDFTFVCPSELIALDHRFGAFKERNVEVIGISVDSEYVHNAWRNTAIDSGGIGAVQYPLVADIKHEITRAYDVENEEGVALRAAFLIDKQGIVRSQIVNDLPLGRSIDELSRLVDALQFSEAHGEVCPAGWQKGRPAMKETPEGVAAYLKKNAGAL